MEASSTPESNLEIIFSDCDDPTSPPMADPNHREHLHHATGLDRAAVVRTRRWTSDGILLGWVVHHRRSAAGRCTVN